MTTPLTTSDALEMLQRCVPRSRESQTLLIQTYAPGSVGGTPGVGVVSMQSGIDWDTGRFLIRPEQPLTTLTPEDVLAIRLSVQKAQSWHAYQAWKKQQDKIEHLQRALQDVAKAPDLGAANLIAVKALQGGV